MSGAAAVISAMDAIATLGSEHEVHAVAACCENLVSGRAYKLGDAITYECTKIQPDEMFD